MGKKQSNSRAAALVRAGSTIGLGLWFSFAATTGFAQSAADQRAACTPDALRLCSSEIPNVDRIVACMKAKKASLSPACRPVFDKTSSLPTLGRAS